MTKCFSYSVKQAPAPLRKWAPNKLSGKEITQSLVRCQTVHLGFGRYAFFHSKIPREADKLYG